jgi:hypothetical protein
MDQGGADVSRRQRAVAAQAYQRAQAWAEPNEDDNNNPVPTSGGRSSIGGNGGALSGEAPHVASSAQFVASRRGQPARPAGPFECPVCGHTYGGQQPSSNAAPPGPDRSPVLLVPCGHTACRHCIRSRSVSVSSKQQAAPATCPCCGEPFSATAFNRAVLTGLPSHAMGSVDVTASAASELAPLPPTIRRTIHEFAADLQTAEEAEGAIRIALAHQRLAELRAGELGVAQSELQDAVSAAGSQGTVHVALGNELQHIEAELKRLELERQLVVTQLLEALQHKAHSDVRVFTCVSRERRIAEEAMKHRERANAELNRALHLVPSDALAAALRHVS